MDRTLLGLVLLSVLLISLVAPLATIMVTAIVGLTVLSTWGSWALLRGVGQTQPEAQRAWD
jgi:hypothetical protein